jgi:hypothetical protein
MFVCSFIAAVASASCMQVLRELLKAEGCRADEPVANPVHGAATVRALLNRVSPTLIDRVTAKRLHPVMRDGVHSKYRGDASGANVMATMTRSVRPFTQEAP